MGVDLAGSPRRRTGICYIDDELRASFMTAYGDDEILAACVRLSPVSIAVDAPLSLPKGRPSLEARGPPHLRACDLKLREMGIKFFPITLGPMRALTARGLTLKARLEALGFTVIETYPGAVQDILGVPRKSAGEAGLIKGLLRLGLSWNRRLYRGLSHDELDAAYCAYVAYLYGNGRAMMIGDPDEGLMALPPSRKVEGRADTRALPH